MLYNGLRSELLLRDIWFYLTAVLKGIKEYSLLYVNLFLFIGSTETLEKRKLQREQQSET